MRLRRRNVGRSSSAASSKPPQGYELFAENRTDVTTVEEIVAAMEAHYGLANRVWVLDRGMMSAENVAWLQQTGRRLQESAATDQHVSGRVSCPGQVQGR